MKKIFFLLSLIICCTDSIIAQKFQASMRNVGNSLEFYVRPDATITTSFTSIEFFVRYPSTSTLTFSNLVPNTSNFPGLSVTYPSIQLREMGFNSAWFEYNTAIAPALQTYTGGQEYKVFSVTVGGNVATANLQLVHVPTDETPYYLSLSDNFGNDLRPTVFDNYFYPTTSTTGVIKYLSLDVVLPLSLLDFTAKTNNQTAALSWKTSNERNASYFDIERSLNSKEWEKIGVQKAGYTDGYVFTDDKAFNKTNAPFYRLKMVDNDGSFNYSPIRQVKTDKASSLKVYPNPAKESITIEGIDATEEGQVIDAIGKVHTTFKGQQTLDLTLYTEGVYFIKMASGKVARFVVSQ